MSTIRLLDCTLRDGGYVNDWKFGFENIRDIVSSLVNAGTDIVEVGFLRNLEPDMDQSRWNTVAELKKVLPADRKNTMFSGMALHNFYDIDKLEPWDGTGIDMIRVTFHDYDIEQGLAFCRKAQDKGYKISCNPINIMGYSDAGVLWLCEQVNKLHPFAFSIVDTFGSMQMQDLERIVRLVDNNLAKDIALGLHLHENLAQSFSLAQRFLDMHLVGRDVTVDASLLGMGRTPGNLCIELIADYMNRNCGKNYDIDRMLDAIQEHILPIKEKSPWGYSPAYFLSAKYNLHRNYAEHFLGKGDLSNRDINHLLSRIVPENKTAFDAAYADELYASYKDNRIDDTADRARLAQALAGRKVLCLAPGGTLTTHRTEVEEFIARETPVVIAANFVPEDLKADYAFFSSGKRFDKFTSLPCPVLCTSNLEGKADFRLDYNSLAGAFTMGANSLIMLLRLLEQLGVKEVALAGADGYEPGTENYCDPRMKNHTPRGADYNRAMTAAIGGCGLAVTFVTPSHYQKG
ncbi:aldolase catalytic domain-containing protein [Candidatus Allofournierella excrementavium]|uniref:aldolase catalytic domain-containing protein n=1 Tax=Candidatus Allofournierella excrementavium TaxID=2838591 RepID=UPI003AF0811E